MILRNLLWVLVATTCAALNPFAAGQDSKLTEGKKLQLDEATRLNKELTSLYSKGDYAASATIEKNILAIREKTLGPDHLDTANSLRNLAILLERLDRAGANQFFDRAREGTFRHVSRILVGLTEAEQRLFLKEKFESGFHTALSQVLRHTDIEQNVSTSVAWVAKGKGVSQDALATRNLLLRDVADPKLLPLVTELQSVQKQLAAIAMTGAEEGEAKQRQLRFNELTNSESQLSKQLALATGSDNEIKQWIGTDELRRAVPTQSLLIDIARFDVFNFKATDMTKKWQPAHYAAWITPAVGKGEPKLVDLGLADEIDTLVQSIRETIQADGATEGKIRKQGESDALIQLNVAMKKLSDKIWSPIAKHVGDVDSILLSPDGGLWLAPWAALPVGESNEPLIKKYSLRLLIRGRDLLAKQGSTKQSAVPVIFADPKFDSAAAEKKMAIEAVLKKLPEADDGTLRSFSAKGLLPKVLPLPNTAMEAKLIEPNIEKISHSKPVLYQERYALESVAKELKRPKLAIFATHGFFLPSQETKKDERMGSQASNKTRSVVLDTSGKPTRIRCYAAGCCLPVVINVVRRSEMTMEF